MTEPKYSDEQQVLWDRMRGSSSPFLLFVCEEATAVPFLIELMKTGAKDIVPKAADTSRLMGYKASDLDGLDLGLDHVETLLRDLVDRQTWVLLRDVEDFLVDTHASLFLDELIQAAALGKLQLLAATTTDSGYDVLQKKAPRIAGLARKFQADDSGEPTWYLPPQSMFVHSRDPSDIGWYVALRTTLIAPVGSDHTIGGQAAEDALRLSESINAAVGDGGIPNSVMVSFSGSAFSAGQGGAAESAAWAIARRYLGRVLLDGESLELILKVFYYS